MFNIGDRVQLREDSGYFGGNNQISGPSTITDMGGSSIWCRDELGTTNAYHEYNLHLIEELSPRATTIQQNRAEESTQPTFDYSFTDYNPDLLYNSDRGDAFAIEAEVGSWNLDDLTDIYEGLDYKNESRNIIELLGLHSINRDTASDIFDYCESTYKDRFPIGSDGYLSGGVHCVMFGEYTKFENYKKEIKFKLLNCPLFLKVDKGTTVYGRKMNSRCTFGSSGEIKYDSKGEFITLKTELLSNGGGVEDTPLEFRCNNIIDRRIYAYYQAILLATAKGLKLKRTSNDLRGYAKNGDTESYGNTKDYKFSEINGFEMTLEDKRIVRKNIKRLIKLLKDEGYPASAEALYSYCKDNGFKYIG